MANDFKAAIRWCLLFMTDDKGALRSADGRELTPPADIEEAFDAAYRATCKVCDGLGYCESCEGTGSVMIEDSAPTSASKEPT